MLYLLLQRELSGISDYRSGRFEDIPSRSSRVEVQRNLQAQECAKISPMG